MWQLCSLKPRVTSRMLLPWCHGNNLIYRTLTFLCFILRQEGFRKMLCLGSHLLLHLLSLNSAVLQSWGPTCSSEGAPLGSDCFSSWRWGKITLEHHSSALLKPNVGIQTRGGLLSVPIKTHCRPQGFWELGCLVFKHLWLKCLNYSFISTEAEVFHNWPEEQPSNRGKCRYKSSAHPSPSPGSDKASTIFLKFWDVDEVCARSVKGWVGNRAGKIAVLPVKCSKQVFKVCRHWNHISGNDWVTQVIIKLDTTQISSALCCTQWFTIYRAINPSERSTANPGWAPAAELWEGSWSLQAGSSPSGVEPLQQDLCTSPATLTCHSRAERARKTPVQWKNGFAPLPEVSLFFFMLLSYPLSQPSFLTTLHQANFPSDNTFFCLKAVLYQGFTCLVIFLSVKWFKLPSFDNWLPPHAHTDKKNKKIMPVKERSILQTT